MGDKSLGGGGMNMTGSTGGTGMGSGIGASGGGSGITLIEGLRTSVLTSGGSCGAGLCGFAL